MIRSEPAFPVADLGLAVPQHLAERICRHNGVEVRRSGEFVLHWMTAGARGHEQPALDLAIHCANELDLPVLVYQALSESVPFASDRHHAFVLEGAADVAEELSARGICHVFHLERDGQRGPQLKSLARRAALVVMDEVPVPPITHWSRRLLDFCASGSEPLAAVTVDTSCLVPMPLGPKEPKRAFQFRDKTRRLREARLGQSWADLVPARSAPEQTSLELPFEPLPLGRLREDPGVLDAWLAECAIDHAVAPVLDTRGGSRAGYERWEFFCGRIRHYAGTRNDPTKHGVSRMSAYLHHGQVSPFRLAREARERGGKGAEKYLDELLIWRELAWHWAFRQGEVHVASAIPSWARETLERHRHDPRELLLHPEDAARGRSGDELWDLCQTSLIRHGELHNNLRMTWGKALVAWSASPEKAVKRLVDLNHRFALDGRDPSSYGGLYWCVGLFDRPFSPEQEVLGTLRPRGTQEHAERLRMGAYRDHVTRPIGVETPRIAVVGAGIAGSGCARTLRDHGLDVSLFDKGRGPGGRMSTRRTDGLEGELRFDHGAQYFTARDERFRRAVAMWVESGHVAAWRGRFVTLEQGVVGPDPNPGHRYVGAPGMNEVVRHLQRDLGPSFGRRVASLQREGDAWELFDDERGSLGTFDVVLCAIPFPQAEQLLAAHGPDFAARFGAHEVLPSICGMFRFREPLGLPFEAAFVRDEVVSWIARDGSKPGRSADSGASEQLVVHGQGPWSQEVLEASAAEWLPALRAGFERATGRPLPEPEHESAHRWRYALPKGDGGAASSFDAALGLGLCGDACTGGRVEGAFLSGQDLAGRVLRRVTRKGTGA